ncbi:MAG: DUF1559 domain-containing protein, partial [Planctomycetota bacterium]|nr:DUF1559 domain-containing protein [Planctomycetota bacterium]
MRTRGLTQIELMVVISIIAILAALLLPVINVARSAATRANCMSNLRQIGLGIAGYADDQHGYLVSQKLINGTLWRQQLIPYMEAHSNNHVHMECPGLSNANRAMKGYAFNAFYDAPDWGHNTSTSPA